ncbi:hypothetical protein C8J57DRAFT_1536015 [Mycena rebaudengoi]|nr:hypothetical protein C8J57DRAFT_1536015 [Mycena rebaudengoi]
MLTSTPLDVVLLVLRLLTFKDVFAVFGTCKALFVYSECRPFWVYANIDMEALPCAPGRALFDYSLLSTAVLKARVLKAWRIFDAWNKKNVEPLHIHTLPLNREVRQFISVPWTQLVILCETTTYESRIGRVECRLKCLSVAPKPPL